jgi:hypothetical protein
LAVVLVVVVVGRCGVGVVAGHGARGPTGAVEGLATGLAAATGCEATRWSVSTADDYDCEDDPADPVVPCAAVAAAVPVLVIASSHDVLV